MPPPSSVVPPLQETKEILTNLAIFPRQQNDRLERVEKNQNKVPIKVDTKELSQSQGTVTRETKNGNVPRGRNRLGNSPIHVAKGYLITPGTVDCELLFVTRQCQQVIDHSAATKRRGTLEVAARAKEGSMSDKAGKCIAKGASPKVNRGWR